MEQKDNLDKIIKDHLKSIDKFFDKPTLFVYKGFPPRLLKELSHKIEPLNSKVLEKGYLDLESAANSKESIKTLINSKNNSYFCTYEEFLSIVNSINIDFIDYRFVVIVNNLFSKFFPNYSNQDFADIEQEIFEGKNISSNRHFEEYYIDSIYVNGNNYLEYRIIDELDSNSVEELDFYTTANISKYKIEDIGSSGLKDYITISDDDPNYYDFRKSLNLGIAPSDLNILVQNLSADKRNELKAIIHILDSLKVSYKIYKPKSTPDLITPREEFKQILKTYWHSDSFRDMVFYENPDKSLDKKVIKQDVLIEDIVKNVELAQNDTSYSDIFITAPTGSGKSILFQIPSLYLAQKYNLVTIVISPLIALMNDQVNSLKERGFDNVALIDSELTLYEKEKVLDELKNGKISILYLSPELFLSYNIDYFIGDRKLGLLVIDEAHLVTTWGRDFRIDYWYLGTHIRKIKKYVTLGYKFPILALTATAVYSGVDDVALQTVESLEMTLPKLYIGNIRRDDISFDIKNFKYSGSHELAKIENTANFVTMCAKTTDKAIVYFPWIKQILSVERLLPEKIKNKVGMYFSDVDKYEKSTVLENFHKSSLSVVLATKAFGMGIDISDIKIVYHHAPSGGLSDYIQEIGRAARDKNINGIAKMDYCEQDLKFFKILYGLSSIKQYQTKFTLEKLYQLFISKGKKQNFLVSSEDFGFIFSDKVRDLDTKVKSALLLISKDLLAKSGFNVLVVRPKSIFSLVYGCVDYRDSNQFVQRYGQYVKLVSNTKNVKYTSSSRSRGKSQFVSESDTGNIYEIKLDKIWEKLYPNESFPAIKKKFFDMKLFTDIKGNVAPRYRLYIKLKDSPNVIYENLDVFFKTLEKVLTKLKGSYFSRLDFENELKKYFKKNSEVKRYSTLVLDLFTIKFDPYSETLNKEVFIQERFNKKTGQVEYQIIQNLYSSIFHNFLKDFSFAFNQGIVFENFLNANKDNRLRMAYVIEALSCGNYEVTGGKFPQVFIRINDVYKIKSIVDSDKYSNNILKDIDERHVRSVEDMRKFFSSKDDTVERWNFLENYFLGR